MCRSLRLRWQLRRTQRERRAQQRQRSRATHSASYAVSEACRMVDSAVAVDTGHWVADNRVVPAAVVGTYKSHFLCYLSIFTNIGYSRDSYNASQQASAKELQRYTLI